MRRQSPARISSLATRGLDRDTNPAILAQRSFASRAARSRACAFVARARRSQSRCSACPGVAAFGIAPDTALDTVPRRKVVRAAAGRRLGAADATDAPFWREERVQRGDTIGSLLARAGVDDPQALAFLRTDPAARAAVPAAARPAGARRDRRRRAPARAALSSPANGDLLAITRHGDAFARERAAAGRRRASRCAPARSARRCSAPPTRRPSRRGDAGARRHLRRRHRLLSRPAARRPLQRASTRRATSTASRSAPGASSPPSSTIAARRFAPSCGATPTAPTAITRDDGTQHAQGVPALADGVLAHHLRLHAGALPSDPADVARAHGHRLRGADRHAGARDRRRRRHVRGAQNGYGNVVMLRHSGAYSTLYAHLSRFAPRLRTGARVRRATRSATSAQTGWATGPHLHYEFRDRRRSAQSADGRVADRRARCARSACGASTRAHRPLARELAVARSVPGAPHRRGGLTPRRRPAHRHEPRAVTPA